MAKKEEMSIEEFNTEIAKVVNKKEKVMYLGEEEKSSLVKSFISTGSTILDYQIANRRFGGIPVGRITEISGDASSGKTMLANHIIANAQKIGAPCFYADTENAADTGIQQRVGIIKRKLVDLKVRSLEHFFETTEQIVTKTREIFPNTERPVIIILDSIAATPTETENEDGYDAVNARMGLLSKTLSLGLKKFTQFIGHEAVTLVLLNQLRYKMNVVNRYEDPFVTPGGKSPEFYTSVRIRLSKGGKVKDPITEEVLGLGCHASITKNKISPPHRKAHFDIMFDRGIDDEGSIYDFLKERDIIRKRTNGNTILDGSKCDVGFEKEFITSEWRKVYRENKEQILNVLDKILIKDYPDTSNLNVEEKVVEKDAE